MNRKLIFCYELFGEQMNYEKMTLNVSSNPNHSQIKMTTHETIIHGTECPGQDILKLLSGKWKPQIMRLASRDNLRFNTLLRQLPGANKQTLTVALRELE